MHQQTLQFLCLNIFAAGCTLAVWSNYAASAIAQITPDSTLGVESSVITTDVLTEQGLIDRIDGGAIRADALFHSFLDFNVRDGQQVYFANPAVIQNIFSRVTGGKYSEIFGTLGVLGNANLYLINPNGILFGPNSQIDVRGSFVGSTTSGLIFDNGYTFGTTAPDAPPILLVNSPVGLASWLPATGDIVSTAHLSAGNNLTLAGHNLSLQGELQAGRDLTLQATNALTIRDSITTPFIASAGNTLLLQGNQTLDLFILNHPDSGLFSLSDLVLRSDNPIIGDAHYFTGGNFQVEELDGSPGILTSPNDPVVRASGDVNFASYNGASLHIIAGGSVTAGDITITGPDILANSLQEQVTLSDSSTTVAINGNTQSTLDIRAGTLAVGTPGLAPAAPGGFVPGAPATGGTGTSANITVNSITNPSGLVFLTNQFNPNPVLTGDITVGLIDATADPASGSNGGSVIIDSRGGLTFNAINVSGGTFQTIGPGFNLPDFNTYNFGGNGGNVNLLASGEIFMPFPSTIYSYGLVGGSISLASNTAINQGAGNFNPLDPVLNPLQVSWIDNNTIIPGQGGNIVLNAPSIFIGGNVSSTIEADGRSGDIDITANSLVTNGQATISTLTFGPGNAGNVTVRATDSLVLGTAFLGSGTFGSGGSSGDVTVRANSITATDGGQIGSLSFGGNLGNVDIRAQAISLSGYKPEELANGTFTPSGIFSALESGQGTGGSITISTGTLSALGGAVVKTSSFGQGNAGLISVTATDSILLDGAVFADFVAPGPVVPTFPSAIQSELFTNADGTGGNITITTPSLRLNNGGTVTASTDGNGGAGSINITATESATLNGLVSFASVGQPDRISRIAVIAAENATGSAGTLSVTTPSLVLTNGGQITAETEGAGNAGDIKLNVTGTVLVDGLGSAIQANTTSGSTGSGGNVIIDPQLVFVRNGGRIAVDSQGTGTGGSVFITSNVLRLDQGLVSAEAFSADGGNITLNLGPGLVLLNGSRISATAGLGFGAGNGGNVTINLPNGFIVAVPEQNSDIAANAFLGNGGNVNITTRGLYGIEFRPAPTPLSDITASSRFGLQGSVNIETPDIDPSDDLVELPTGLVDASRLVAQGCGAGATDVASALGEFTVTGRGGLPPSPDQVTAQSNLATWETLETESSNSDLAETTTQPMTQVPTGSTPKQIVEFQGWTVAENGEVTLVAETQTVTPHSPWNPAATCQARS